MSRISRMTSKLDINGKNTISKWIWKQTCKYQILTLRAVLTLIDRNLWTISVTQISKVQMSIIPMELSLDTLERFLTRLDVQW